MKLLEITNNGFGVEMTGGSIGDKSIRSAKDLKGRSAKDVFPDKKKAAEKAKRMNKGLSSGEKKHYGIKYIVAEIKNGKYTGK